MKIYIIIIIFFFSSCLSNKYLPGVYTKDYATIILKDDSTFSYRYKFEFAYKYSEGVWKTIGKGRVLLNSVIQDSTIHLQIFDDINKGEQANSLKVDVGIPIKERQFYICSLFINDSLYDKLSCDSLIHFVINKPIINYYFSITANENIPTRFIDTIYSEKVIPIKKFGNYELIKFQYNDSLFNYRIFSSYPLNVRKRGLFLYENGSNKKQWYLRSQ